MKATRTEPEVKPFTPYTINIQIETAQDQAIFNAIVGLDMTIPSALPFHNKSGEVDAFLENLKSVRKFS